MDCEQRILKVVNNYIKNQKTGLFCYNDNITTIEFVCDFDYNEKEDMSDKFILSLKNAPFKNYFYIQKTKKTNLYLQVENIFFSLIKEIFKNHEKIIFYHKIYENNNKISINKQIKILSKK